MDGCLEQLVYAPESQPTKTTYEKIYGILNNNTIPCYNYSRDRI